MKTLRRIFTVVLLLGILFGGASLYLSDKYVVPIIMYHHVSPGDKKEANRVSPESFRFQMQYLMDHGYRVITVDELVEVTVAGKKLPPKSVVITFDDGYEDNFIYAFPVLKKLQLPAAIFICPDLIGQAGYLTWERARTMQDSGIIDFGSHTMKHTYLPDVSVDQQRYEITESKRVIEQQLGQPVKFFVYPSGGFTEDIKGMLKAAGYKGAFATNRGYDRFNRDVYELKRIRFNDGDTSAVVLWAKLSGFYNLTRKAKHPY